MADVDEVFYTSWITSLDNVDHLVTDRENATGARENRGTRQAVCGAEFRPGPMEIPPGWTCRDCLRVCQAHARAHRALQLIKRSSERDGIDRRKRIMARLLGRRGSSR